MTRKQQEVSVKDIHVTTLSGRSYKCASNNSRTAFLLAKETWPGSMQGHCSTKTALVYTIAYHSVAFSINRTNERED